MEYIVKLEKVREDPEGTRAVILFQGENICSYIMDHCIKAGTVIINDGRTITPQQRRKAYALERDIAEYCGYLTRIERIYVHNELKTAFCQISDVDDFSLSSCRRDVAKDYINYLIDYALADGIPLSEFVLDRTDDIDTTLIACIRRKKCCLCGRDGEIHHIDAVGMGRNRDNIDDSGSRIICLCREHHREYHKIGRDSFFEKYKVYGVEKYKAERI